MPSWDDEYMFPYLSVGHAGNLIEYWYEDSMPKERKKFPIGFQIPEKPCKPKGKKKAPSKRKK